MKYLLLCVLTAGALNAATIAVIDSGVDIDHRDFVNKLWINPVEIPDNGRDEDGNGYQDDVFGWNFAENNNLVIDRSYLGTFSDDPRRFFEIQGKVFLGKASPEEIRWMQEKQQDEKFFEEMAKFGNFIHGTHVAGITQEKNEGTRILSVKLIPTEVKPFAEEKSRQLLVERPEEIFGLRMRLLKRALNELAKQQMNLLEEIAAYVGQHEADVANGSFGTGFNQAKMITDNLFKVFFFRSPKKDESDEVALHFMNALIEEGQRMVNSAKSTLFVFAAGNDGSNNDLFPTSPTNVKADNVISVAATYKREFLAPFSNYGEAMVEVAAPGMLIHSQIPGDEYLEVSGTSQAAPYVANVAGAIKDINPALGPKEMKQILMETVDKKSWLVNKVKSQGIVNKERALAAAEMSLRMSTAQAIELSLERVADVPVERTKSMRPYGIIDVLPLPSMFR